MNQLPPSHNNALSNNENKHLDNTDDNIINAYPYENKEHDDEIDLREIWNLILRRRALIFTVAALVFAIATIYTFMQTPIYQATTKIQINPEETKIVDFGVNSGSGQAAQINSKDYYQTQYEILKSRKLARRTIDDLGLRNQLKGDELSQAFFQDSLTKLLTLFSPNKQSNEDNDYDETEDVGGVPIENALLNNLTIRPVKNSQIVALIYNDSNPQRARRIVNSLAYNFIDLNLERKRDAATYAEEFIKEELISARSILIKSEVELLNYAKRKGIMITGDNESIIESKARTLAKELLEAETDRIKAESTYEKAQQSAITSASINNSTLQSLKSRLANLETKYQAELSASEAYKNLTVQTLRNELIKLQRQFQGLVNSAPKLDTNNYSRYSIRLRLSQLKSQYEGLLQPLEIPKNGRINSLESQLASLEREYNEKLRIYTPSYDIMQQLEEKIITIQQQIERNNREWHESLVRQNREKRESLRRQIAETERNLQNEIETSQHNRQLDLNQKIRDVRRQMDQIEKQLSQETQLVKNSRLLSLEKQLKSTRKQIQHEVQFISDSINNELLAKVSIAKEREKKLQDTFRELSKQLERMRDESVEYKQLRRVVESNNNIYSGLLERQKEVGIAGGVTSNNISILDPAITPYKIHKPNKKLTMAMGAILGLVLGVALAFLIEFMDDRIKTTDELAKIINLPLLGLIPMADDKNIAMSIHENPITGLAESFRTFKTNLLFSTRSGVPKTLAITSSTPNEGKSTTCINLATVFTQANKKVLIIDCDLRNPSQHKLMDMDNEIGLTHYLIGLNTLEEVTQTTAIPNLSLISTGQQTPNPVEMLSSERFDDLLTLSSEHGQYDLVILDSPPILGLADAIILSKQAEATILTVAMSQAKKMPLSGSYQRLLQAQCHILGVVATKTPSGAGYGYNYETDYYSYGQEEDFDYDDDYDDKQLSSS